MSATPQKIESLRGNQLRVKRVKPSDHCFYFLMSLLVAVVVVYGFSWTVNVGLIHPPSPRPMVLFRPEAEDEVLETRRWYEERREGLGAEFASAVDAIVERIVTSPLAFPCAHGETRRALLRRFPYAIYFRVLADGAIVVLAVHGRVGKRVPRHTTPDPAVLPRDEPVFLVRPSDEAGKTWA